MRVTRRGLAILPLIQEQPGLLAVPGIDVVGNRSLFHCDGRRDLTVEELHLLLEALEQAHLGIVAAQHAFGAGQLHQQADQRRQQRIHALRQRLQHQVVPVLVDNQRRQQVRLAMDEPVRGGVHAKGGAEVDGALQSAAPEGLVDDDVTARDDAQDNLRLVAEQGVAQRAILVAEHAHDRAGLALDIAHVRTVDPGVSRPQAIFATGGDAGIGNHRYPITIVPWRPVYDPAHSMSTPRRLRVGVLGAGAWASFAHLPGFTRDPRCEVVAIADPQRDLADAAAQRFGIPQRLRRSSVADRPRRHRPRRRLHAQRHPLRAGVGGPLCRQARAVREAGGLRLPRHPPRRRAGGSQGPQDQARVHLPLRPGAPLHARAGRAGLHRQPYIFNGFEQNSQWLDPQTPLRQANHEADQSVLQVSSLEGYGAPIIDIAHLLVGSDLSRSSARCATSCRSGWSAPPAA